MASAERLLNEAQYAFASISFGESLENKRHAARARSLCKKILRRYPTSSEAAEARAILRRLGDETFATPLPEQGRFIRDASRQPAMEVRAAPSDYSGSAGSPSFDWSGLLAVIFLTPRLVLAILGVVAFVLLSLFGPFLVPALFALVLITGPFRALLGPARRRQVEDVIVRANEFIAARRRSGTGLV